jgi:hypothetical protein
MNITISNKDLNLAALQEVYVYNYYKVYNKFPIPGPVVTKPTILINIELLQQIQRR